MRRLLLALPVVAFMLATALPAGAGGDEYVSAKNDTDGLLPTEVQLACPNGKWIEATRRNDPHPWVQLQGNGTQYQGNRVLHTVPSQQAGIRYVTQVAVLIANDDVTFDKRTYHVTIRCNHGTDKPLRRAG